MLSTSRETLCLGFVILGTLPLALAHGPDHAADTDGAHDSMNMPNMEPTNYFSYPEHTKLMYAHIISMIVSWVILMPLG